jgi:hypothetical protein
MFLMKNIIAQEKAVVTSEKITVNETSHAKGTFSLQQTNIEIPQADFESVVFIDKTGYPGIDFNKFDQDLLLIQMKKIFNS